jgi:hypothetical protein
MEQYPRILKLLPPCSVLLDYKFEYVDEPENENFHFDEIITYQDSLGKVETITRKYRQSDNGKS